jgi:MFS transporter, BCD family, chlorophyll transporter
MMQANAQQGLGWFGIIRLGLVQTALGSIVVLTTSTINRVMIVELSMLAIIPGILVAWHYALQILRPRWGHGSDNGGTRTPWIIGGMATLAMGGLLAAMSVWLASTQMWAGFALAALAFTLIGIGVGAAGTSMLVMLAETVVKERRAAAATIVWTMMIMGFILTTVLAGKFLDPFSFTRLVAVAAVVTGTAFIVSTLAVLGIEKRYAKREAAPAKSDVPFQQALAEVWQDRDARNFAIFIFISMLGYSAQDLILEPFAGFLFGMTPGETTSLSGTQNTGVLLGMILVGVLSTFFAKRKGMALRNWTVAGCLGSALALIALVGAARFGTAWPLKPTVFALGFTNGVFAVAAIGSMFSAAAGAKSREGIRMGLFGASQAIAFGAGGFCGTALADVMKATTHSNALSYGTVFAVEAVLFIAAAILAMRIGVQRTAANPFVMAAQHDLGHST